MGWKRAWAIYNVSQELANAAAKAKAENEQKEAAQQGLQTGGFVDPSAAGGVASPAGDLGKTGSYGVSGSGHINEQNFAIQKDEKERRKTLFGGLANLFGN